MHRIVIAPDSFKGCMSSREVAAAMAAAARECWPEAEIVELPLADGGEGTLDVLAGPLNARIMRAEVHDPLGRPISASHAIAGETAIIEVAEACGMGLLSAKERNPLVASSAGVGELVMAAYSNGCRHFVIGLGGTATCDGGAGMLSVPGIKALIDCTFELLCDVDNPFVGPQGAARVFAPQKGASPQDVEVLENRMIRLAETYLHETGTDVSSLPGAGAAGGLGGAFMAYFHAKTVSGIDRVLDLLQFDSAITGANLIITGEGKSDSQSLHGKVPYGVLKRAGGIPVALLSGRIDNPQDLEAGGFHAVIEISPKDIPLQVAMDPDVTRLNLKQRGFPALKIGRGVVV